MTLFDYVIVGSGPSGVAAALRLQHKNTCLIDVGNSPKTSFKHASLQTALEAKDTKALLGSKWEMLDNIIHPNNVHPKLRAEALRFVMQGEPFSVYSPANELLLRGACSYAAGGMSNVWGGQLLRYTKKDLDEVGDWPIDISSIESYYDELETHIGISGQIDHMYEFLGKSTPSMPPIPMVPSAKKLLERYLEKKQALKDEYKLLLGHPRLAIATTNSLGRSPHSLGETEFFSSDQPGFYTAKKTLDRLESAGSITYLKHHKLLTWHEDKDYVELKLRNVATNELITLRAKHLLLGCGTLQTARLVLKKNNHYNKPLPFIDHPPILLPLFMPGMFGTKLPEKSYPIQLIATLQQQTKSNMISMYYPGGMLWSDLLLDIPLPLTYSKRIIRGLLGGMLVAQIWEASTPHPENRVQINAESELQINYRNRESNAILRGLLRHLAPLGAYSLTRFGAKSPPGWGFHHAGCLPMRHSPEEFETHVDGRLWNSMRIRVIDGSVLPSLPAKNHSLTLMSNASRIADEALRCGY